MPPARVVAVAPGSPAAAAGLLARRRAAHAQRRGGARRHPLPDPGRRAARRARAPPRRARAARCVVEKAAGAPLGLELDSAVFDRVRTCDNHCPFCFIYQLPKGMRRSLYLKDDDYRLSFLYGNFTTLTRFTEADLERVRHRGARPALREHPRHRPRRADAAAAQPARRHQPALARRAARRRHRGARPDRRVPGHQRRRRARRHAARRPRPLPDARDGRRGAARRQRPHHRARHAAAHRRPRRERVLDIVERVAGAVPRGARPAPGVRVRRVLPAGRPRRSRRRRVRRASRSTRTASAWPRTFEREVRAALARRTPVDRRRDRAPGFFAWVDGAPAEGYRAPRSTPRRSDAARRRARDRRAIGAPIALRHRRVRRPGARAALATSASSPASPVRLAPGRRTGSSAATSG